MNRKAFAAPSDIFLFPDERQIVNPHARMYAMGLEPVVIPAQEEVVVKGKGQVIFRPASLYVSNAIASDLEIVDIQIGKNSQMVSAHPFSADLFSFPSSFVWLKMDTYRPGMEICVKARNISNHPVRCAIVVFGPPVD